MASARPPWMLRCQCACGVHGAKPSPSCRMQSNAMQYQCRLNASCSRPRLVALLSPGQTPPCSSRCRWSYHRRSRSLSTRSSSLSTSPSVFTPPRRLLPAVLPDCFLRPSVIRLAIPPVSVESLRARLSRCAAGPEGSLLDSRSRSRSRPLSRSRSRSRSRSFLLSVVSRSSRSVSSRLRFDTREGRLLVLDREPLRPVARPWMDCRTRSRLSLSTRSRVCRSRSAA